MARRVIDNHLQPMPVHEIFWEHIACAFRSLRGSKLHPLACERQAHHLRLIGVRDEGGHGRLSIEHVVSQEVKLAKILAPHQSALEGFGFDEIPKSTIQEQARHVARRSLVSEGALGSHERQIIVEHGLVFAFALRLSTLKCQEIADGLHHALHEMAGMERCAAQESIGASSVGAHIAFEEVGKGIGEGAIFPAMTLACDEVEERIYVMFQQVFAQRKEGHHQAQLVL